MTRSSALTLALLPLCACAAVVPAAAGAAHSGVHRGVAPLLVPNAAGKFHTSTTKHVSFLLPSGDWKLPREANGRARYTGSYTRRSTIHGKRCDLLLTFGARGQKRQPKLVAMPGSHAVRRGVSAGTRWLTAWNGLPPVGKAPYALGSQAAPAGVSWRWTRLGLGLQAVRGNRSAACARSLLRLDLAPVVTSTRVETGDLPKPSSSGD